MRRNVLFILLASVIASVSCKKGGGSGHGVRPNPLNRYHPLKNSPYNFSPGEHGAPDEDATEQKVCVFTPLYGSGGGYGGRRYSVLDRYHGQKGSPFEGNPGDHSFPTDFSLPYAPSSLNYVGVNGFSSGNNGHGGGYRGKRSAGYQMSGGYTPFLLYCATTTPDPDD